MVNKAGWMKSAPISSHAHFAPLPFSKKLFGYWNMAISSHHAATEGHGPPGRIFLFREGVLFSTIVTNGRRW